MRTAIGVVGPGSAASADDERNAAAVGAALAAEGWVVVTGGVASGVMAAALRGAREAGGTTVGILPGRDAAQAAADVDIAIVTGVGEARNNIIVLTCAALVVCGMSPGTASEVALALRAGRPVVLVQPREEAVAFFRGLGAAPPLVADDPARVVPLLREAGMSQAR